MRGLYPERRCAGLAKGRVKHHKAGYIIAAIVTAAILGALVWLMFTLFPSDNGNDSVPLKKTPLATRTTQVSVPDTKTSVTQKTEPPKEEIKVGAVKLENGFEQAADGAYILKWQKPENAGGYRIYYSSSPSGVVWKLAGTITDPDVCKFAVDKDSDLHGGVYSFKVEAFAKNKDGGIITGGSSNAVELDLTENTPEFAKLYLLPKGTQVYDAKLQAMYILTEEGYYTGDPDEKHKGYIAIDYMFTTAYVKQTDKVKEVKDAVALHTSVIGQEGGQIFGSSACGPTAAAVIVRYDKGEKWDKDELIRYTEKNKLADQGSMMGEVGKGGMSAPMVIKLIQMYSGGKYSASNIFTESQKPSGQITAVIDKGMHSILSVRYAWGIVHHPYSIIHFVEPSAYAVENGELYFYYGDTAYGNGPKGLKKVSAKEVDESVATVEGEPKCLIVLDGGVQKTPKEN